MQEFYTPDDFFKVKKCDAHMHMWVEFDAAFVHQALADNFSLVAISVDALPDFPPEEQDRFSLSLVKKYADRVFFVSSFSMQAFHEPGWIERTLNHINEAITGGAIGVKVWKNIGMELKNADGKFLMIDNEAFQPILDLLIERNIPLLGHLGEPKNTWLPLEKMTVQGDRDYFSANPEYHMYLHPEYPGYDEQISARDNMLAKNPSLRFIGAHLGSLEWSVGELAKRLDRYPNMAVDLAERISHLQHQAVSDWQSVRDFLVDYQDRIIYGTDLRTAASDIVAKGLTTTEEIRHHAHEIWFRHWVFFTGTEAMTAPKVTGMFNGMGLPKGIVDKIYRTNAEQWYPKLSSTES